MGNKGVLETNLETLQEQYMLLIQNHVSSPLKILLSLPLCMLVCNFLVIFEGLALIYLCNSLSFL